MAAKRSAGIPRQSGPGATAPDCLRRWIRALAIAAALGSLPTLAQNPYNFYGGDVDADRKNAAIEACEYEELVEKQRCNKSLNKTSCIARIREECRVKFGADQSAPPADDDRRDDQPR